MSEGAGVDSGSAEVAAMPMAERRDHQLLRRHDPGKGAEQQGERQVLESALLQLVLLEQVEVGRV